jgi:hypothetical protein
MRSELSPVAPCLVHEEKLSPFDLFYKLIYLFMGGYPKFWVKMASGELSNFDAF